MASNRAVLLFTHFFFSLTSAHAWFKILFGKMSRNFCLVAFLDFESLEALFRNLNLDRVRDVFMSAYYRLGAGRPPFNPLRLLCFKIVLVLKGYCSQRTLEREVRVDRRVMGLCGLDVIPSHSTVVRFERRIGFDRLKRLIGRVIKGLVSLGFVKGLDVVLDSKPFEARWRGIRRIRRGDGLTRKPDSAKV
jgi:transposase